jgi:serine/threonine protein kinase
VRSLPGAPFGKYLLIDAIAQGGMASIHRAVLRGAAGFAKVVALKRVLPVLEKDAEIAVLFQDEARIASLLSHANICQVFDFGEVRGEFYLAMELVEGTDVAGLVQKLGERGRDLPMEAALFLCSEAARGLGHAHDQRGADGQPLGLVHRDISPQNILVSRAGDVKITDFGIAKALGKAHRTASGVILGKLHYMAPEQLAGIPVDGRADVFSLGVLLYELLTGTPLYPPRAKDAPPPNPDEIHARDPDRPSSRNPAIPPELDALVLRALARRREDRIGKASELARELGRILHQRNPGYAREDFGALVAEVVPPLPPLEIPPEAATPPTLVEPTPKRQLDLPTRSVAPSQRHRRRRLSGSAWLGLFLVAVIVVSAGVVVVRIAAPGTEAVIVRDAAPSTNAPIPLLPDAAVDRGEPFTLVPAADVAEERRLNDAVRAFDVTRRGTPTEDYAAFVTALDDAIAGLVLGPDGRPVARGVVRPQLRADAAAVEAVLAYVEATGKLPRTVSDALRAFLGNYPAFVPRETLGAGVRLPPYSAAALAVWLAPREPRWRAILAVANEHAGRWCAPAAEGSRRFAPELCDRAALLASLPDGDRTRTAFARWDAAAEGAVKDVKIRAGEREGEERLELTVAADPTASYALVAGGFEGERASLVFATGAEAGTTRLEFRVPAVMFKPVLLVRRGGAVEERRVGP